jgi:hypothetical protein
MGRLCLLTLFAVAASLQAQQRDAKEATTRVVYAVGDILRRWEGPPAPAGAVARLPAPRETRFVQYLFSTLATPKQASVAGETVELVNGANLIVVTTEGRHALLAQLLAAMRRGNDVQVFLEASLYEVDAAFHARLMGLEPLSIDEAEKRFLEGGEDASGSLTALLKKQQKPVIAGARIEVDERRDSELLSRYQAVRGLPSPEQVARGDKTPQIALQGFTCIARAAASSDRRYVRVKLSEKSVTARGFEKVKGWPRDRQEPVEAELPLLDETAHVRLVVVPDGGSVLLASQIRPTVPERRWLLLISARIRIEEEERALQKRHGEP